MPSTHKYHTRSSNLPIWSPITPPLRQHHPPPPYDHPWSLGTEFGDHLVIEELHLGAPAIPHWWKADDDHTHYVLRRKGGEKVVFSEEEWEVSGREWEAERGREMRGKRLKRAREGGMSRAARRRAWKKGAGRRRGRDGKFV